MTAVESKTFAQQLLLPAMLPRIGLDGCIDAIECRDEQIAKALDVLGGIDHWLRSSDKRLVTFAVRNQWYRVDDGNRDSFTIRVDIGGPKTEAHKRVLAIKNGGLVPDWTLQGYITPDGRLHHAGAIPTRDLFTAFIEAAHHPQFKTWNNPADGHEFWAGFWTVLRKYGHGDRLVTLSAEALSKGMVGQLF